MDNGVIIDIVKVNPGDVEELRRISLETFTESFYHLNSPENFDAYVSKAF